MTETKRCPFCGEEILAVAIKCKHCGSMITASGASSPGLEPGGAPPGWHGTSSRIPPGTEIREYRIAKQLGEGGMGQVYLAEHTYTGQVVAIKAVHPSLMADQTVRRRFLEEGRLLARLDHPNIVSILAFFEEAGRFFLVMPYIRGRDLATVLRVSGERGQSLSLDGQLQIARGILRALACAHGRRPPVIHRDIKPANILMNTEGRVVLTDFGIAKALGRERLTSTAGLLGTIEYMSPEQVQGREVGPASDVYSAGIVLYQMLAGAVPFPQVSQTGVEVIDGHRSGVPVPLHERCSGCPIWLSDFVGRCLAKDPADRFPDGQAALDALRPAPVVVDELPLQKKPSARWLVTGAALLTMLALGATLALFGLWGTGDSNTREMGERSLAASTPREDALEANPSKNDTEVEDQPNESRTKQLIGDTIDTNVTSPVLEHQTDARHIRSANGGTAEEESDVEHADSVPPSASERAQAANPPPSLSGTITLERNSDLLAMAPMEKPRPQMSRAPSARVRPRALTCSAGDLDGRSQRTVAKFLAALRITDTLLKARNGQEANKHYQEAKSRYAKIPLEIQVPCFDELEARRIKLKGEFLRLAGDRAVKGECITARHRAADAIQVFGASRDEADRVMGSCRAPLEPVSR